MKNKRKETLLSSTSSTSLGALGGADVFLFPMKEKSLSALEVFFEKEQKEINFEKPFEKQGIDFMVDSLLFSGEAKNSLKEKLKKGFHFLNERSITARKAMMMIDFQLPVQLFSKDEGDGLYVNEGENKIFVSDYELDHLSDRQLGIEFLHETGHLDEHKRLRPLGDPFNQFVNKDNQPITGSLKQELSVYDHYRLNLILEAEKQAMTYQILSESMPFHEKAVSFLSSVLSGVGSLPFSFFKKESREPANRAGVVISHEADLALKNLKNALLTPKKIFSKEGRKALKEQSKNEAMADFILNLTHQKKSFAPYYKGLAVGAFLGGILLGASGALVPLCLLGGASCGVWHIAENKRKFQKDWKRSYHRQALNNLRIEGKNHLFQNDHFKDITAALSQKYQQALTPQLLQETTVDEQGVAGLMRCKKLYDSLPAESKKDLLLFVHLLEEERPQTEPEQHAQAMSVQLIRHLWKDEESREDFKDRLFEKIRALLIEEQEDFAPVLMETSVAMIEKFNNKELKNLLLKMKEKSGYAQEKFLPQRLKNGAER